MIDIKFLRENPDIVKQNIKNKFQEQKLPLVDEVIELDEQSRKAKQEADALRAEKNKISKQIGALMAHFLDGDFKSEYLRRVAEIRSEEYYIRMMQAWYFATALAKQREAALPYFSGGLRDEWVRKKAICKAIESRRVDDATKELLRGMR